MANDTLNLIKIINPFDRSKRIEKTLEISRTTTLGDLVRTHAAGVTVTASIDGQVIPEAEWDRTVIRPLSQVLLVPAVEGGGHGGGKAVFNAIAMIAITVISYGAFGPAGSLIQGGIWGTLAMVASVTAGGMILSGLTPGLKPSSNSAFGATADKMAYGWNPQTTQQIGLPVPHFYGRVKLTGNVISAFTEPTSTNDSQTLSAIIALCRGPIKSITAIKINNTPIENL